MWISMIGQLVIYKESCLLILPHVTSFFLGGRGVGETPSHAGGKHDKKGQINDV